MSKNKKITTGQVIRRIRSGEIAPIYTLLGGDPFLEDYFISELSQIFLDRNGEKMYFSLDQDPEEKLFEELSAISMFKLQYTTVPKRCSWHKAQFCRNEVSFLGVATEAYVSPQRIETRHRRTISLPTTENFPLSHLPRLNRLNAHRQTTCLLVIPLGYTAIPSGNFQRRLSQNHTLHNSKKSMCRTCFGQWVESYQ